MSGQDEEAQLLAVPAIQETYVAPVYDEVMPPRKTAVAAAQTERTVSAAEAAPLLDNVPGFIAALLAGNRDQAFDTIRAHVRAGGESEELVTHTVCALDDAYRARLEGTECHPEVARLTADCAAPFLERLIASLTTAIDGSYSSGMTGVRLATARALAVVNG
jgi:hypothetical protein